MQTFPDMRRDSAYKEVLKTLLLLVLIVSYGALTDRFSYLPPLLGVAFILFCRFMETERYLYLFPILVFLLFFEATKGFLWLSTIIFFFLSYFLFVGRAKQVLGCQKCLIPLFVAYTYGGFYLFASAMGALFEVDAPDFSVMLFYFVLLESLLGMVGL